MTHWPRLASFVVVGCAAAAVHFATVVWLVSVHHHRPLLANVAGWSVAFCVSFLGQWQLTFRTRRARWQEAMPRFLAVSLAGFGTNEAAYAALLRWSALRYDVLLALVLAGVAVMTYFLSSRWAFRRTPPG